MYSWRITKYDPTLRDDRGSYTRDEWTSCTEIGKRFDGRILTLGEYLRVESLYVSAIIRFMDDLGIENLSVQGLERRWKTLRFPASHRQAYPRGMLRIFKSLEDDMVVDRKDVELLAKLNLREKLWCRLLRPYRMFVHFGYDYYMYIGASSICEKTVKDISKDGLFVEPYVSPYRR